jgi:hypothetical protein
MRSLNLGDDDQRRLVDLLCRVPCTKNSHGRSALLGSGAPSINRDENNKKLDLTLIVQQLREVGAHAALVTLIDNAKSEVVDTELAVAFDDFLAKLRRPNGDVEALGGVSPHEITGGLLNDDRVTRKFELVAKDIVVLEHVGVPLWHRLLTDAGVLRPGDALRKTRDDNGDEREHFLSGDIDEPHLLVCARAPRSPISLEDVMRANYTLDTKLDSASSVTLVSLDELLPEVEEANQRLAKRGKALRFIGVGVLLQSLQPRSPGIITALAGMTKLPCKVDVVLTSEQWYHIVYDSLRQGWFVLFSSDGTQLLASDDLVQRVREKRVDLVKAEYGCPVEPPGSQADRRPPFDREAYLRRCYDEYQRVKYHALSLIPTRLHNRIRLERLYIENTGDATETGESSAIVDQFIDDQLGPLPENSVLRDHLRKQILATIGSGAVANRDRLATYFRQRRLLAIVGEPGSGKSVSTKREILRYCSGSEVATRVHTPVFVGLSDAARRLEGVTGGEAIMQEMLVAAAEQAQRLGLPISKEDVVELESNGTLALFLDGFDEVSDQGVRLAILDGLTTLGRRAEYSGNRIVLTSRPGALRNVPLPNGMHIVHVNPFSLEDIKELSSFLLRWSRADVNATAEPESLGTDEQRALDALIRDCKSNRSMMRLAQNPFLLTMLVGVYLEGSGGRLIVKRHGIYQESIRILMHVRNRYIGQPVPSGTDVDRALSQLAACALERPGASLESNHVIDVIADALRPSTGPGPTREELITLLRQADNAGLIIYRDPTLPGSPQNQRTSFRHYSFLEYFAAIALEQQGYEDIVKAARGLVRHNVALLASARASEHGNGEQILRAALSGASDPSELLTGDSLELALELADEMTDIPGAGRRLLADAIDESLARGALRSNGGFRDTIGNLLGEVIGATGDPLIIGAVVRAIQSDDPVMAAAAVDLVSHFPAMIELRGPILEALRGETLRRGDKVVADAYLGAMERRPELRGSEFIDRLRKQLGAKGMDRQHAALRAVEAVPSCYPLVSDALHRCLETDRRVSAGIAGRATLRGMTEAGRTIDVWDPAIGRVVLRALERWGDIARPGTSKQISLEVRLEDVRGLLKGTGDARLLGIRLLPWVANADEWILEKVRDHALAPSRDVKENIAGLAVLSMSDAPRRFLQERDFARIESLAVDTKRSDRGLRIAALRALAATRGGAGTGAVVRARVKQAEKDHRVDAVEHRHLVDVLCKSSRDDVESVTYVHDQALRALKTWSGAQPQKAYALTWVQACQDVQSLAPIQVCNKMLDRAKDYKVEAATRAVLFKAWARVRPLDGDLVGELEKVLKDRNSGLFEDACAALSPLVERVRSDIVYLEQARELLSPLRSAIVRAAPGVLARSAASASSDLVEQAGRAIREMDEILATSADYLGRVAR